MTNLLDSIPEISRCLLEMYFNEDLIGAEVIDFVPVIEDNGQVLQGEIILHLKDGRKAEIAPLPVVEDDGQVLLGEIILHLKDGCMLAIVPVMRGMIPWLKLKILDVQD